MSDDGPIYFQILLDPLSDVGTLHGRSMTVVALMDWEDSGTLLPLLVGYTSWDGTSNTLNRRLPFECAWFRGLYCDQFELIDSGIYENQDEYGDDNGWPIKSWCKYRLRFSRPPYVVRPLTGSELNAVGGERFRYVSVRVGYMPRERRLSGLGFVFDDSDDQSDNWQQVPDEAVFVPEHTVRSVATGHQVPENAVPWGAIAGLMGYVNNQVFNLQGMAFGRHKLLFRGVQDMLERYQQPDGSWCYDLPYVFEYRPGGYGWNGYTRPTITSTGERTYGRMRRVVPGLPINDALPYVYPEGDFRMLFTPGATFP